MSLQVGYYALSLFAGALVAGAVAVIAWKRAVTSVGRSLALLMAAVFTWSLAAAFEAAVPDTATKVLLSKIEYLGHRHRPGADVPLRPPFPAIRRPPREVADGALWVIPSRDPPLAATNEEHHLIWSGFRSARRAARTAPHLRARDLLLGPRRIFLHPPLRHDRLPAPGLLPVQGHPPPAGPDPAAGLSLALDRQRPLPGRARGRGERVRLTPRSASPSPASSSSGRCSGSSSSTSCPWPGNGSSTAWANPWSFSTRGAGWPPRIRRPASSSPRPAARPRTCPKSKILGRPVAELFPRLARNEGRPRSAVRLRTRGRAGPGRRHAVLRPPPLPAPRPRLLSHRLGGGRLRHHPDEAGRERRPSRPARSPTRSGRPA